MLYCNNRVVQVDFKVKESKSYRLFLDDELCEVSIHQQPNGKYTYTCRLDTDSPTPLNEQRKREQAEEYQSERQQILAALAGMVLGGLLIWWLWIQQ